MAETDPKSVQDLTAVVQTLLQQMQDKFQTMSDQIIGRNILYFGLISLRNSFEST
uniref:Heat shock factor-binding protein 1 n=1 Tax=Denticeps clupeoides TaxID=299321 RepID=A0AAY4DWP1_9TELE